MEPQPRGASSSRPQGQGSRLQPSPRARFAHALVNYNILALALARASVASRAGVVISPASGPHIAAPAVASVPRLPWRVPDFQDAAASTNGALHMSSCIPGHALYWLTIPRASELWAAFVRTRCHTHSLGRAEDRRRVPPCLACMSTYFEAGARTRCRFEDGNE
jgi:hypothetical protein